ncbi:MAG: aspartyl protease family protein [Pyrinomonadaceae bacterium]
MLRSFQFSGSIIRACRPALVSSFVMCSALALVFHSTSWAQITESRQPETRQLLRSVDKLILRGEFAESERLLRIAFVQSPKDSSVKLKLAFTLLKSRSFAEAYKLSFEVAKDEPANANAFAVLGAVLLAGGRFNDSRSILTRALQISQKESLAIASFGMLEFYENQLDSSLDYLATAKFLAPENPDFIFAYAQVAARAERYQEAADAYKQFLLFSRSTDDDRRERIKGLIAFLEYLGLRTSLYAISGTTSSTLAFDLKGNRPVILLKVNNYTEPLKFVLDTGSGMSVISYETAKRLKLKPIARGGHAKGIGGTGKFEIVYGFLREVNLGTVKVRNVPVYIREFHHNIHDIDGYIGISLISKFLTTVDYGEKTFTLNRLGTDSAMDTVAKNVSLPLRLTSSGFLSGEVKMDGISVPMNFIVDTGASVSVVSDTLARNEPFSSLPRKDPLRVIGSAGVTENVECFTLPRISFGDHTRDSVTAIALDLEVINDASGFEQSGILGGNFFLDYRMTFDFRNSRLIFIPTRPSPSSAPPEQDEIKSIP